MTPEEFNAMDQKDRLSYRRCVSCREYFLIFDGQIIYSKSGKERWNCAKCIARRSRRINAHGVY